MGTIRTRSALTAAVLFGALWAPAGALAAAPTITTGGISNRAQTSATLHGRVDPNGTATSYTFQYGTTRLYGATTPAVAAGAGKSAVPVSQAIGALAPATRYHYRLVGLRGTRVFAGKDRTFTTRRQPLGVSLAAAPNPIRTGHATVLTGVLSGTGNANRQVQLQANPWPYTGGFLPAANNQVTNALGGFQFTLLSVAVNTQYRVLMPARPAVVSPIVVLGTMNRITRHAKVRRGHRRGRLHVWGTITPALDGAAVYIQKLRGGVWVNVAQTFARHTSKGYSRYSRSLRQKHGGRYRAVVVDATGAHSPSASRSVLRRHMRR